MKRNYTNRLPYLVALQVGQSWYFPCCTTKNVESTMRRLKTAYPDRDYTSVSEEGGVRVFRQDKRKRKRGGA